MKNIFKLDKSILKNNKTLVKETKTVSLEASVLFYEKNIEHKLTIVYIVDLEKNILVESLYRIKSIKRKDVLFNDKKLDSNVKKSILNHLENRNFLSKYNKPNNFLLKRLKLSILKELVITMNLIKR